MRTTVDLPDALFRRAKSTAALRGTSMKELIVKAIEREIEAAPSPARRKRRVRLPLVRLSGDRRLDLTDVDLDDLLA